MEDKNQNIAKTTPVVGQPATIASGTYVDAPIIQNNQNTEQKSTPSYLQYPNQSSDELNSLEANLQGISDGLTSQPAVTYEPLPRLRRKQTIGKAPLLITLVALLITSGIAVIGTYVTNRNAKKLSPAVALSEQAVATGTIPTGSQAVLSAQGEQQLIVNGDGIFSGILSSANFKGDGSELTNISVANCDGCVELQPTSPGSAQDGNLNINGTGIFNSIGVGTSPTFALDVAGDINTSSSLKIGGTTVCTEAGCTLVGGLAAVVNSLNGSTGALTLQGTANRISVSNTDGILTITTPQDIAVTSTPTFGGLVVNGSATVAGTVNLTALTIDGPVIVSGGAISSEAQLSVNRGGTGAATASGGRINLGAAASGTNADITSTSVLNTITPSGVLTIGSVGQQFILQGSSTSTITAASGGFSTILGFTAPSANQTVLLPDASGTVCLSTNNCGFADSANAFIQGGNSFGTTATLGTNDNFGFQVETNGTTRLTISNTGVANFSGKVSVAGTAAIGSGASPLNTTGLWVNPTINAQNCSTMAACGGAIIQATETSSTAQGMVSALILGATKGVGTSGEATGLFISSGQESGGGIITNNYGLYIQSQTAGNGDYGIYVEGADTYALFVDSGATRLDGTLEVQTLGATNTASLLCLNASNQLAACNSTGTGAAFVQGGNSFGATATLGTNDANDLVLETSNTPRLTITSSGTSTFSGNLDVNNYAAIGDLANLVNSRGLYAGQSFTGSVDCGSGCFGVLSHVQDAGTINPALLANFSTSVVTTSAVTEVDGLRVQNPSAFGTITNNYGVKILSQSAGTNDYGVYVEGADTYALFVDSGATRLDGTLEVKTTASIGSVVAISSSTVLNVGHDFTSADNCAFGCYGISSVVTANNPTFPTLIQGGIFSASTAAASFTTNTYGIQISSGSKGAGSTITSNYGLFISNQTKGNTNNYGLNIAGASGGSGENYALFVDSGATRLDGTLEVQTLGATNTASLLCLNASNQLAACNSTGTGAAFVQGGNSFGATATLGTNDANDLVLKTNNTSRLTVASAGTLTLDPIGGGVVQLQNSQTTVATLEVLASASSTLGFSVANVLGGNNFTVRGDGKTNINKDLTITDTGLASFLVENAIGTDVLQVNTLTPTVTVAGNLVVNGSSGSGSYAADVAVGSSANGLNIASVFNSGQIGINVMNSLSAIGIQTSSGITTGNALNITGSLSGGTASNVSQSGDIIGVSGGNTYTGAATATHSGNYLELTRAVTNSGAGITDITGDVALFQSSCTQTSGTCNDSSNILHLNQQYAASTGAVLNIQGAGTGNLATLDTTNANANGLSIDVQSSSASQYALRVTTNNGGTTALKVGGDAAVAIANTLDIDGTVAIGNGANVSSTFGLTMAHTFTSTANCSFGCYGISSFATATNPAFPTLLSAGIFGASTGIASFTIDTFGIQIQSGSRGAGSTITNNYGLSIADQTKGNTNNYGLYIQGASGGSGNNYALFVDSGTSRFDGNIVPGAASTIDIGSSSLEIDDIYVGDNNGIRLGLDQDATLAYDETTDGRVELTGSGASLFIEDRLSLGVDTRTIADNGTGTNAILTLTPTASYVEITCNDTNGCDITMGEVSAKQGDLLVIVAVGTNTVNFADTSGVSELSTTFAAGQYDTIQMIYMSDRWIELSRSNN